MIKRRRWFYLVFGEAGTEGFGLAGLKSVCYLVACMAVLIIFQSAVSIQSGTCYLLLSGI